MRQLTQKYKINLECMLCVCLNNVRFTTNDFCLHNTGLNNECTYLQGHHDVVLTDNETSIDSKITFKGSVE